MKRGSSGRAAGSRPTFAQQLEALADQAANRAFSRAEEMNALAKASKGLLKRRLYESKHIILQGLVARMLVEVTIDREREVGLLSVKAPNGRRLHTSGAWLGKAKMCPPASTEGHRPAQKV